MDRSQHIHARLDGYQPSKQPHNHSALALAADGMADLSPTLTPPREEDDTDDHNNHERHQHTAQQPSRENCDRRRPQEEDNSRLAKMPSHLVGKTVSPFLKEHIPGLYAPIGKNAKQDEGADSTTVVRQTDPNSKFCYRHRPDSKCRRAADETKMGIIQSVSSASPLSKLQLTDRPRNSTALPPPTKKPSPTCGPFSPPPPPNTES